MKNRKIKEFGGYVIKNPNFSVMSKRDTLIVFLHNVYKHIRCSVKRIFPLNNWQRVVWEYNDIESCELRIGLENAYKHNDGENPYYNVEYIHLFDFFPKEKYAETVVAFKTLYFKHKQGGMFNTFEGNLKSPTMYELEQGSAWSRFCDFSINERSSLYETINRMSIKLINLTSSYCGVVFTISINQKMKDKLSKFALSDIPERREFTVPNSLKSPWAHILKGLSISHFCVKDKIINGVISDIVWNTSKELRKATKTLILQKDNLELPHVVAVHANILHSLQSEKELRDGKKNENDYFWGSIGISWSSRHFMNDNACISLEDKNKAITFIYDFHKTDPRIRETNKTIAFDYVDQWFFSYCIAKTIDNNLRKKLSQYQTKIPKIHKKTENWLKLHLEMESYTFYEKRFINEYSNPDDYILQFNGFPKELSHLYENVQSRIEDTKKLHSDITTSIASVVEVINTRVNYRLQKIAIVLAIIALLLAVVDSENVVNIFECLHSAFRALIYRIANNGVEKYTL